MPRQPEFWSALAAFAGTLLFGILNGILVGVLVTLLAVLHRVSRPRVAVLGKVPGAGDIATSAATPTPRRARAC